MEPNLQVTQADRDAAAEFARQLWPDETDLATCLKSGLLGADRGTWTQAFARHRTDALEAISAENARLRNLAGSAFATLHTIATASDCEQSRAAAKEAADEIDAALKEPSS